MSKFEEYLEAVKKSVEKQPMVKTQDIEVSKETMTWDEAIAEAERKGKRLLGRSEMISGEIKDNPDERESLRGYGRKIVPAFFTQHVGKEFWSGTQVQGITNRAYMGKVSERPKKNVILNRGQTRKSQQRYDKMLEFPELKTEKYYALFVKE